MLTRAHTEPDLGKCTLFGETGPHKLRSLTFPCFAGHTYKVVAKQPKVEEKKIKVQGPGCTITCIPIRTPIFVNPAQR